jgi:putative FmdB family regulatory protein
MPIYEYYCPKCKLEFDLRRPMSESNSSAACPSCGGDSQKLVSAHASKVDHAMKVPRRPAIRPHSQQRSD